MADSKLCVSHGSALHYWRTNPPWYVLEGADRDIRSIRNTPAGKAAFEEYPLSEAEFGADPIDILVPENAPRCPERFRRHAVRALLPRHALYPLHDGIHVVSPELCLVQYCQTHGFLASLEMGMEFCGTYALRGEDGEGGCQRDYSLMDAASCRRHYESWRGLKGLKRARRVARYLVNGAASPMETKLYLLLCLPQQYGGYHLPVPELNPEVALDDESSLILRKSKVSPDMRWEKAALLVEYDGRYHESEWKTAQDSLRKTVLESMDYTVLQVKRWQVYDPLAFDKVACTIARRLGVRIRPLTLSQSLAREDLRRKLLGA
ncbi:MAG: DUF559 domain-containing protein [Coriobacteriia bacterium]|nr:DUF559 domain-containing protein [Coriobacteriia bacterium]